MLSCGILGVVWGCLPLIGWSYYSLESHKTSCCVEWADGSLNVLSFNISLFILVFLLPLSVMVFTCLKIFNMVIKSVLLLITNYQIYICNPFQMSSLRIFIFKKNKETTQTHLTGQNSEKETRERVLTVNFGSLIGKHKEDSI
jgi:hypothetical protein